MLANIKQLPHSAQIRLLKINAVSQQSDWKEVRKLEKQAYERWSTTGDWLSYGITLISLGDGALKCRNLKRAKHFYQEAQRIFHLRVDPKQRRNEAAATYGLALTAVLSGRKIRALELLEHSSTLLAESEEHWVMMHANYKEADRCEAKRKSIEELTKQLTGYTEAPQPEEEIPYGHYQRSSSQNLAQLSKRRVSSNRYR